MLTRLQVINYILVPLPSWLLLIYAILFPLRQLILSRKVDRYSTRHVFAILNRTWFPHNTSTFFILAVTGIAIDEIVHLALSKQSLGVLYFTPVGTLVALFVHHISILRDFDIGTNTAYVRRRRFFFGATLPPLERGPLVAYWLFEIAVQSGKTHELARLKEVKGDVPKDYKLSRQIFDVIIIICLFAVLLILEYFKGQTYLWLKRGEGRPRDVEDSEPIAVLQVATPKEEKAAPV